MSGPLILALIGVGNVILGTYRFYNGPPQDPERAVHDLGRIFTNVVFAAACFIAALVWMAA